MRLLFVVGMVLGLAGVAAAETAPEIHINMPTVGIDAAERSAHCEAIKRAMKEALREAPEVRHVDLVVSKLSVEIGDEKVDVSAEIKVVISTDKDEMRSFGSGTATYSIKKRQYRPERTPAMRHQALGDALDGLQHRLRAAYRRVA